MNHIIVQTADEDDPCPWGDSRVVLTGSELSVSEKSWLGRQIVTKKASPIMLAMRYGLQRKAICKYGLFVRKGRRLCSVQGKPRILDDIAERRVKSLVSEIQNISTQRFNEFIIDASRDTAARRRDTSSGAMVCPNLSRSSFARYRRRLRVRE